MRAAEFRVFLSSTFTDLQPEREQLVKKVFPRIRALCRERGVEFTEIDLRWGITTEEARSGKVVRICLDEIGRCRPYFIGILGMRYGWRPTLADIEKDPDALRHYPWLAEYIEANKSIVEMEITHGALRDDSKHSAFIYEQTSNRHLITEADQEPFDNLKATLRSKLPYKEFSTPVELGEQVYADLVAVLDRDWPQKKELTPLESEQLAHEAFALNRTQAYIANPDYYRHFEEFIGGDGAPLLVWGKSGLGKSALMAYLTSEYKILHPEGFVMRHFVGAAASASSPIDIMRHVMLEIKSRYGLPDELPTDDQKYSEEFPGWLAKVKSGDKFIVAIDAVNQLTGIGPEMHWLPEFIPANVRLIISTTPEVPLDQLRKRNWQELEIKSLDGSQRTRISEEFLSRYHKHLSEQQLDVIARSIRLESPLFLRTILEELRVFGVHRELDERLATYISCEDENELFQAVLERMERDYGETTVREVMSAIWASRFGLTETELLEITKLTRYALSEFLIALEFHLMRRSGLYTFFHNYLRQAVEFRYLYEENEKKLAHNKLAEYFSTREYSTRRRDEEPWQLQQAGELTQLEQCLRDPQMAAMFESDREVYEAFSYWKSVGEISFNEKYIEKLKSAGMYNEIKFNAYRNIISLLITAGAYKQAEVCLLAGLSILEDLPKDDKRVLETQDIRLTIENHLGRFESVINIAKSILEIISERNNNYYFKLLDQLAYAQCSIGQFLDAVNTTTYALNFSLTANGKQSYQTAMQYKNLGAYLTFQGNLEESEKASLEAWMLYSKLFGEFHPESARCRMNIAACCTLQKKYEEASFHYGQVENIFLNTVGPVHPFTLQCKINIAYLNAEMGNFLEARQMSLIQLEQCTKVFGDLSLNTLKVATFIGYTYYLEKNYLKAKEYYDK
ncbi:MAG TPA: tetratricopeptide repeat protein, partial [Candidatus Kapabacteria bacterium]|nr:tetratricopeptide repeat protein [Candidatus Kapabacteria bacterium]